MTASRVCGRATARTGAYGLTVELVGQEGPPVGLQRVPSELEWPTVRIDARITDGNRPPEHTLDDDTATMLLIEGEHLEVERRPARAVYHLRDGWSDHEIVHPYLAGAASVFSTWYGRMAFHAGGIVVDGVAWGLLGRKEAGKTTTLTHLHARGVPVVTDDLLVLDGTTALTGPRCLDLRPPTMADLARHVPDITATSVRDGERYRVALPPAPLEVPFGGWILLDEGPGVDIRGVPAHQRFAVLTDEHRVAGRSRQDFLTLLSRPMWVLTRPRSFATLPHALDVLLARLGA